MRIIGPETEPRLDWLALTDALRSGHLLPRAEVKDSLLKRGSDALLTRSAWIDGLGLLVKAATVFPGNTAAPSVNGGATLYSDKDGRLEAVIDFHLLTKWKTAGDSLLAARLLARKDSENILIVGAGTVARSLTESYRALFPKAAFTIYGRSPGPARTLADICGGTVATNLQVAARKADIIACATMATSPVVLGEWLRPGQHLDLIGAWKSDMREADDAAIRRAKVFVDSRATTIGHIGEIDQPVASGALRIEDIRGDFYDIASGAWSRAEDDITLFKNGGGAHLDLITAKYFLSA
jgi:ornithine cyclodeaminase